MRLNLRKINQLIRDAWVKGQQAALRGGGKSSCYAWSDRAAREFFPDIDPQAVTLIAKEQARLHWDAEKREVTIVPTAPFEQVQSMDRSPSSEPQAPVTYVDLDKTRLEDEAKSTTMIPRIHLVVERPDGKRSEHEAYAQVTPDMLAVAEDLLVTLTTGTRPPLKGLYELCALAFDTTREDAKERLTAAAFGMSPKKFDERKRT